MGKRDHHLFWGDSTFAISSMEHVVHGGGGRLEQKGIGGSGGTKYRKVRKKFVKKRIKPKKPRDSKC